MEKPKPKRRIVSTGAVPFAEHRLPWSDGQKTSTRAAHAARVAECARARVRDQTEYMLWVVLTAQDRAALRAARAEKIAADRAARAAAKSAKIAK
jgi:hypothetical protein